MVSETVLRKEQDSLNQGCPSEVLYLASMMVLPVLLPVLPFQQCHFC